MSTTDITSFQPRRIGVCQHCARFRPLQPDGLLAIHYLRRAIARAGPPQAVPRH